MKRAASVAIDLGAESCRVSLLRWDDDSPQLSVVHRFANGPIRRGNSLVWNIEGIIGGVTEGLCHCAEIATEGIASIGVDGWAVDYVRLADDGRPLGNPRCYRDERTIEAERRVHQLVSRHDLYELTGIQFLRFNTLYQLYADQQDGVDPHARWINLPEYILFRLGGQKVAEYTNATHTQLVDLNTGNWCQQIFDRSGLDLSAAPQIVESGAIVGRLRGAIAELTAFQSTLLIAPACHDTASAVAGIPAEGDDWAFISSGTWSLVGTLLDTACATHHALSKNFTNLGAVGKKVCFLKNVNGMWLLQQCLETWREQGHKWTIPDLVHACSALQPPTTYFDVDDPDLLLPGNIPEKIRAQLKKTQNGNPLSSSDTVADTANLIFHGLAKRYAEVLKDIAAVTGKKIQKLYIVGGGNRNTLLNRLTAEQTGLEVILGPAESSTIGNFAVQLATLEGGWKSSVGVSSNTVSAWARALTGRYHSERETVSAESMA
ncbi:MAG: carbohydrate kinase [Acidobacteria bacterium]|nr:MAG: carbohydrate kinase [Acidobacteriota bacterium]